MSLKLPYFNSLIDFLQRSYKAENLTIVRTGENSVELNDLPHPSTLSPQYPSPLATKAVFLNGEFLCTSEMEIPKYFFIESGNFYDLILKFYSSKLQANLIDFFSKPFVTALVNEYLGGLKVHVAKSPKGIEISTLFPFQAFTESFNEFGTFPSSFFDENFFINFVLRLRTLKLPLFLKIFLLTDFYIYDVKKLLTEESEAVVVEKFQKVLEGKGQMKMLILANFAFTEPLTAKTDEEFPPFVNFELEEKVFDHSTILPELFYSANEVQTERPLFYFHSEKNVLREEFVHFVKKTEIYKSFYVKNLEAIRRSIANLKTLPNLYKSLSILGLLGASADLLGVKIFEGDEEVTGNEIFSSDKKVSLSPVKNLFIVNGYVEIYENFEHFLDLTVDYISLLNFEISEVFFFVGKKRIDLVSLAEDLVLNEEILREVLRLFFH